MTLPVSFSISRRRPEWRRSVRTSVPAGRGSTAAAKTSPPLFATIDVARRHPGPAARGPAAAGVPAVSTAPSFACQSIPTSAGDGDEATAFANAWARAAGSRAARGAARGRARAPRGRPAASRGRPRRGASRAAPRRRGGRRRRRQPRRRPPRRGGGRTRRAGSPRATGGRAGGAARALTTKTGHAKTRRTIPSAVRPAVAGASATTRTPAAVRRPLTLKVRVSLIAAREVSAGGGAPGSRAAASDARYVVCVGNAKPLPASSTTCMSARRSSSCAARKVAQSGTRRYAKTSTSSVYAFTFRKRTRSVADSTRGSAASRAGSRRGRPASGRPSSRKRRPRTCRNQNLSRRLRFSIWDVTRMPFGIETTVRSSVRTRVA